jgi:hypothetical protein
VEVYGQAGRLNACNKLRSLTQKINGRRKKFFVQYSLMKVGLYVVDLHENLHGPTTFYNKFEYQI